VAGVSAKMSSDYLDCAVSDTDVHYV
jgi:hypothetical protein